MSEPAPAPTEVLSSPRSRAGARQRWVERLARFSASGLRPAEFFGEALPALFALGEKPAAEQLLAWLPDRWLLRRSRESPRQEAKVG